MGDTRDTNTNDRNRDPITGAPGAHPAGVGAGAVAGGVAGGAIGAMAGPVGAAVGAAIGAVAGGLAGKGVAEMIDPTAEEAYWREHYSDRPYHDEATSYDEYAPAYRYGWESRMRHQGRSFVDVDTDLEHGWENARGTSRLDWERAKAATRDAWERIDQRVSASDRRDTTYRKAS